jgi:hypothetical protein
MSPHTFPTSPSQQGEQRKFINPSGGFVGANVFGGDGKPTAIAVEPGGEVWLSAAEERMTAEAPRSADDNPFVRRWEEVVEWDGNGEPLRTVPREGTLVLCDEPTRPTASSRFVPERGPLDDLRATREAMEGLGRDADGEPLKPSEPAPDFETVKGAPPLPEQPAPQGQPQPDEVVGTPDAVAANDAALAAREGTAEQPVLDEGESELTGAIPT